MQKDTKILYFSNQIKISTEHDKKKWMTFNALGSVTLTLTTDSRWMKSMLSFEWFYLNIYTVVKILWIWKINNYEMRVVFFSLYYLRDGPAPSGAKSPSLSLVCHLHAKILKSSFDIDLLCYCQQVIIKSELKFWKK